MKPFITPVVILVMSAACGAATAASTMQPSASRDNLTLTIQQAKTALIDINKIASKQTGPSNFTASVGAVVPKTISLQRIPTDAARQVPALKSYDYALLKKRLLIVNPVDNKIVQVINRRA